MTVGVVGAGVTGLSLSHYLADRDVDSVAFDARAEPGGVVRSETVNGHVLERGPQRLRLSDEIAELVDDVGLRDDLLTADDSLPMYVYAKGDLREAPLSASTFLTTDLLSWRGKLRVLAEPLTDAGSPDESAAALFRRKFGDEAYERFVGPLFGGIYGSDPAEMPAGHALDRLLALERREGSLLRPALRRARSSGGSPPVSFAEGLQQLPRALSEANADRVHLDRPVTAVRADGDDYVLATPDGDERVDRVVLTTPADVTADLVADLAPDAAERLRRLTYNPLALVYLRADVDREGFGYQVARDEDLRTLGVSWNGSLFDRDGLFTCFLGGMDDPEILDGDDATLAETAATELRAVLDADPEVVDVARLDRGFPAWDRSWDALDGLDLPEGVHLATNYTARMGVPGRVREAARLADRFSD